MKRLLIWSIVVAFLISCKENTVVDPTKRVRPVSLQISSNGTEYKLSWQEVRIVCITAPCPDIADVEAEEYDIQIATSELGEFKTYQTVRADQKSINIPTTSTGAYLVARIVSKNKSAPSVNSNSVMVSNGSLSQSLYYPGFGTSGDATGGDVTSDGSKAAYSVLVDEGAGHYVTPLYITNLQNEQPISTKLITRQGAITAFSADGQQLAYPSNTDNGLVIYEVASEQKQVLPIADAAWVRGLAWSPDGKWLAFSVVSNDESRLWKIATSGGTAIPLSPSLPIKEANSIRQTGIDWSPDGQVIAVSRARSGNTSLQWRAAISFYDPNGGGEIKYFDTQPGWIDTAPSISPNGKQLAFLSTRSATSANTYSLWVRDLTTGTVRQVNLLIGLIPSDDYTPRWLGNERLLFMGTQQGKKGYFSVFL
ncbi:TolB family protein [Spirosoma foliorum]|uniref:PD40 domain-containing protein n=1 Tax=Spirosoma foliorum TaxID=2710596 RepID=A0A7G5H1U7_9BACT|nr:PD40 domain-containing protein [Spirosoma foliorum]QMW05089.1 PD40 domain-containing protein [Spirosoma foliorum]